MQTKTFPKKHQVNIRLDQVTKDRLSRTCEAYDMSASEIITNLIDHWYYKNQDEVNATIAEKRRKQEVLKNSQLTLK